MANKPPIMICPGEVIATKSSGVWQDWEVSRIIMKQVITIINGAILLSHLLSPWELLGTIQFTDNNDKILISPKCFGSIGHHGPEMLSIQILDVGENSSLADKDTSDSKSLGAEPSDSAQVRARDSWQSYKHRDVLMESQKQIFGALHPFTPKGCQRLCIP